MLPGLLAGRVQQRLHKSDDEGKNRVAKRILVIEDDARYLDLLRIRLEHAGYEVALALDGETGLERAREERPDLVLTDVLVPKKDGFEVCNALKSDPELRSVPVVMMSAIYSSEMDRRQGLQAGAEGFVAKPDAVLDKPVRFDRLLATLSFLLGESAEAPGKEEWSTVLLVDDDPRSLRLLKLVLSNEKCRLREAGRVKDALAILESEEVDLVLSDIQLPGRSGLEFLQDIRRSWPQITVITMTAYGREEIAVQAMKLGADDYLTKPINTRELGSVLRSNLEKHRAALERDRLRYQLRETSRDLMSRLEEMQVQNAILEETGKKLQRAHHSQTELVATFSQELRTPLTVVKGALALMAQNADRLGQERRDELVHRALLQTERVIALTTRFLDLERIDSGTATFNFMTLDLAATVGRACDAMNAEALAAGVEVEFSCDLEQAPCWADAGAVRRIVEDLVGNALKHSLETGKVEVTVRPADEDAWRIEVADRGPGVPDNMKELVFERFVTSRDAERRPSASGLGLTIVRSLARQHDGRAGVEDRPGGGATFFVELPQAPVLSEAEAPAAIAVVGLENGLADDLSARLGKEAEVRVYADATSLLAEETPELGTAILDLGSAAISPELISVLTCLRLRGLRRACLLPPRKNENGHRALGEEAKRLFDFVEVFDARPTSAELAAVLVPGSARAAG